MANKKNRLKESIIQKQANQEKIPLPKAM